MLLEQLLAPRDDLDDDVAVVDEVHETVAVARVDVGYSRTGEDKRGREADALDTSDVSRAEAGQQLVRRGLGDGAAERVARDDDARRFAGEEVLAQQPEGQHLGALVEAVMLVHAAGADGERREVAAPVARDLGATDGAVDRVSGLGDEVDAVLLAEQAAADAHERAGIGLGLGDSALQILQLRFWIAIVRRDGEVQRVEDLRLVDSGSRRCLFWIGVTVAAAAAARCSGCRGSGPGGR